MLPLHSCSRRLIRAGRLPTHISVGLRGCLPFVARFSGSSEDCPPDAQSLSATPDPHVEAGPIELPPLAPVIKCPVAARVWSTFEPRTRSFDGIDSWDREAIAHALRPLYVHKGAMDEAYQDASVEKSLWPHVSVQSPWGCSPPCVTSCSSRPTYRNADCVQVAPAASE